MKKIHKFEDVSIGDLDKEMKKKKRMPLRVVTVIEQILMVLRANITQSFLNESKLIMFSRAVSCGGDWSRGEKTDWSSANL